MDGVVEGRGDAATRNGLPRGSSLRIKETSGETVSLLFLRLGNRGRGLKRVEWEREGAWRTSFG